MGRNLETLAPIADLANKAFSAFEKYQQLQSSNEDERLGVQSNPKEKPAEEEKTPAGLANVLLKFIKFKNGIEKKNLH